MWDDPRGTPLAVSIRAHGAYPVLRWVRRQPWPLRRADERLNSDHARCASTPPLRCDTGLTLTEFGLATEKNAYNGVPTNPRGFVHCGPGAQALRAPPARTNASSRCGGIHACIRGICIGGAAQVPTALPRRPPVLHPPAAAPQPSSGSGHAANLGVRSSIEAGKHARKSPRSQKGGNSTPGCGEIVLNTGRCADSIGCESRE